MKEISEFEFDKVIGFRDIDSRSGRRIDEDGGDEKSSGTPTPIDERQQDEV